MEVEKKKNGKETYTRLTYHDIKIKVNFKEILFFFFFSLTSITILFIPSAVCVYKEINNNEETITNQIINQLHFHMGAGASAAGKTAVTSADDTGPPAAAPELNNSAMAR